MVVLSVTSETWKHVIVAWDEYGNGLLTRVKRVQLSGTCVFFSGISVFYI